MLIFKTAKNVRSGLIQYAHTKQCDQSNFLTYRHLQPPNGWNWQKKHHEISHHICDASSDVDDISIAAGSFDS